MGIFDGAWDFAKNLGSEIADPLRVGSGNHPWDPKNMNRATQAEQMYGGVDPQGNIKESAKLGYGEGLLGRKNYMQAGQDLRAQQQQLNGVSDQYGRLNRQYGQLGQKYGRIANGLDSISAEQLRQGLQQNQASQMSMAAGAAPQNQAMAQRTAMMNAGRQGMGLSGQQAMAGLQERRDALAGQLGAMQGQQGAIGGQGQMQGLIQQGLLQGRGQDVQMGLGGTQNALQGYGGIEANRTSRYNSLLGVPTQGEQLAGAGAGLLGSLFGMMGGGG